MNWSVRGRGLDTVQYKTYVKTLMNLDFNITRDFLRNRDVITALKKDSALTRYLISTSGRFGRLSASSFTYIISTSTTSVYYLSIIPLNKPHLIKPCKGYFQKRQNLFEDVLM